MLKIVLLFLVALPVFAELKPLVSIKEKLIYENSFSGNKLPSPFVKPKKGAWTFPGGFMDYKEKPDDNHPGVLKFDKVEGDFIVELEIRLPKDDRGDKFMAGLVINTKGHLGRINVSNRGFSTRKDKSDQKVSVKWKKSLDFDKWYTLTFECVKDTFVGQFNGTKVTVSHKEIENSPVKTICLTGSNKAQFRNFRVYKADPKKEFKKIINSLKNKLN